MQDPKISLVAKNVQQAATCARQIRMQAKRGLHQCLRRLRMKPAHRQQAGRRVESSNNSQDRRCACIPGSAETIGCVPQEHVALRTTLGCREGALYALERPMPEVARQVARRNGHAQPRDLLRVGQCCESRAPETISSQVCRSGPSGSA